MKIVNIVPDEEFKRLGLTAPGWEPEAESTNSETTEPKASE
jgi:hypothetical protein